jgi:hypothetical protein
MRTEIIGADVDYMDADSLAALEVLDDAAWPVLVEACQMAGAGDVGIDNEIALTHETLAEFDDSRRNGWSERGDREEIEVSGVVGRVYENIQVHKGARRCNLIVLDFGAQRVTMVW